MALLWALVTAIADAIAGVIIGKACKKSNPLAVSLIVTIGTLVFFLLVPNNPAINQLLRD